MVVCKCRKATKQYCFLHKTPVCGECICSPEHQICVVRTYSEWVIDGEYDWPPKCCLCQVVLEEGSDCQTTRLGCLHVLHTNCLDSHIKSCPTHTAPAGYVCPLCSTPIWPPKSFKDSGSTLHSKLKEAIIQSGLEKNLFGNHPVLLPAVESRAPPPAFASDPLIQVGEYNSSSSPLVAKDEIKSTSSGDIVEIDVSGSAGKSSFYNHDPNFIKTATPPSGPGATTRKTVLHVDRQNSDASSYFADDEDMNRKKYTRRGPLRNKFFRKLLPFWSNTLPILPVTRKDAGDDASDGRLRQQKSSRIDPRRILLVIAIMACLGTMGILYYRLAQRGLGEEHADYEKP